MLFGRGKQVGFTDGLLSSAELAKQSLVSREARVKMCSVFGKLPAFGFELEMLGDKGPVERWHPLGNEVVLSDPGLVVVVKW